MEFQQFLNIVWKQKPTGYDGFEGLIAKLLERLTGQGFHLSRSGDQGSRDMASNSLMAECKDYKKSTTLKIDNLLAKFATATLDTLKPDIWMVVTTKRLDEQYHSKIEQFSRERGISYFSIDAQGNEQSFLAALCAYARDITDQHMQQYFADQQEADDFSIYLQSLNENPEFSVSTKAERLKQELS